MSQSVAVSGHTDRLTFDLLEKRVNELRSCEQHFLNSAIFSEKPQRRYRRGKNRCVRCGLKRDLTPLDVGGKEYADQVRNDERPVSA